MKLKISLWCLLISFFSVQAAPHEDLRSSMKWVKIGNPNADFETTGDGRVEYVYWIGKQELSVAEIQAAHAAEPAICDGNEDWWNTGRYSVGTDAPATRLNWHEAARFCNWLTSGSSSNGVYQLDAEGLVTSINRFAALEQFGTVIALPTEKEWYKAAYWTGSGFSDYANGTDTAPEAEVDSLYNAIGTPWPVGSGTVEQNGTFDMAGNLYEWTETLYDEPYADQYIARGGYYSGSAAEVGSGHQRRALPGRESQDYGLRVAVCSGQASNEVVHDETVIGMEFVAIENEENPVDTNGRGSVAALYQIGKFEVTIEQFMAAYEADPSISNGDEDYWQLRYGLEPTVPASLISWHEAAKFCNWLTSGSSSNGAYQVDSAGIVTNIDRSAAAALYDTLYVIPTEDEWYKAAYWTGSGYSEYPNGSSNPPVAHTEANYCPIETPWSVELGMIEQNGTVNMTGNLCEFTEDESLTGSKKSRGGYFLRGAQDVSRNISYVISASTEHPHFGFRPVVLKRGLDSDSDGIDDDWEIEYFGNATNAIASADSDGDGQSNREEYIAGFNPTNKTCRFEVSGTASAGHQVVRWNAASGRVYSVYWTTNLLSGFQCLESNIPWTRTSFTNQSESSSVYYRIEVQAEESSAGSGGGSPSEGNPDDPFWVDPPHGGDGDVDVTPV
jgi:formylglycine-generating enzyme